MKNIFEILLKKGLLDLRIDILGVSLWLTILKKWPDSTKLLFVEIKLRPTLPLMFQVMWKEGPRKIQIGFTLFEFLTLHDGNWLGPIAERGMRR